MKIAIITGASSGLGAAFARRIDATLDLDVLWLIARREDRLQALARELKTDVRIWPLDLTLGESVARVQKALEETEGADVRVLVNAAGFGKLGTWKDLTDAEVDGMIDLNCKAAVHMTTAVLPFMGRGGRVLEVCSCAGFQPLQGLNVYAATKAFLLHFTRALRWETLGRGLRITAVCPGWIKTEFLAVARDTKNSSTVRHFFPALRPETVARLAMAENALGLAVACLRFVPACDAAVRQGGTGAALRGTEICGKTVGIVGTGAIGLRTARLFLAFGAKVIAHSRTHRQEALDMGIEYVSLEELMERSDIVSLHVPSNGETRRLISAPLLARMKPTAILINAARGAVVDNAALADALNQGRLAGAGIDVFDTEPPLPESEPLLHAKNTVLTPHVAFATDESMLRRAEIVFHNLDAWLAGRPENVCRL